jgi:PRTRC genetic system protein F
MDDDDPLMSIGATCFVAWDDPDFSWEAASHFEEYEMNGGECTDAFYVLKADPTNKFELAKLVTSTQEIVKRYALVSRLLHHFPMG